MKLLDIEIPTAEEYDRLAYEYMASLPLEHYMELPFYGVQRGITLASFRIIAMSRPDVQTFNEVLIQFPREDGSTGQAVPDQMVILHDEPIAMNISFNNVYQPTTPFIVLEYVSKGSQNERKDYVYNRRLYERELKIPYYLIFDPHKVKLTFLELSDGKYRPVVPNAAGRMPVPELDVEVALLDGWVRYWFEGDLVPLPEDLAASLKQTEAKLVKAETKLVNIETKLTDTAKQLQNAQKSLDDEKIRADQEASKARRLAERLKALGIDPDA